MCRPAAVGWFHAAMQMVVEDLRSPQLWRAVVAEAVGTLLLTLVGCGSCVGWGNDYSPSVTQIALCFGLSVATLVWALGHISGGHINPAVTTAFLITRKISLVRGFLYVIGQIIGAIVGAALLKGLTPPAAQGRLGATEPDPSLTAAQAFGTEFVVTYVLVLVVFACCDRRRDDIKGSFPLTIGLAVTMCHLFAVKYTGSSMNPARSFGPAVVQGVWTEHWVYWCGPLLGGITSALVYENIFASNASYAKARGYLLAKKYDPDDYPDANDSLEPDMNGLSKMQNLQVAEAEASV